MIEHMGNIFLPVCSTSKMENSLVESIGDRAIYYRLGESRIYSYANKNIKSGGLALNDIIPRMVVADQGFYRIELTQLDKNVRYELFDSNRFRINCKKAIEDLINKGKIVMVYSEEFRIPTSIPYIVQMKGSNDCVIYVNISDFVKMDQYGICQVEMVRNYNALMAVLFSAAVAYKTIKMTSRMPADAADGMILVYANMFERVINNLVNMDPVMRDKVKYLATEFALIQMYGTAAGTELFYRYKGKYFPKLAKIVTDSIDSQFQIDCFDNLELFISELARVYPSLKNLTMYLIYDKWVRLYGPATALSIDYLGYHIYTICMVLLESPLITRMALEPVLEKNQGAAIFKRFQSMIGSN